MILLVRHAESEWNAAGRWQGHGNPPLSPRGREQAAQVAVKLAARNAAEPIDRLYCSDLLRARETAGAIGRAIDLEPLAEPRLRELDVGRWTGLTRPEIEARAPELLAAFEREDPDVRPGGGETRREIRARVRGAALELAASAPGELIALVVHLGVIRALVPGSEPGNCEVMATSAEAIAALG